MAQDRPGFEPRGATAAAVRASGPEHDRPESACRHRETTDDFFCLRYGVWYASIDCAYRTRHRTAPGCLGCDQGRFNLKRHAARVR